MGTERTWFKGTLIDTVFHYNEVCIDTIIYNLDILTFDTVFYVSHYEKGFRYIDDSLFRTDYKKQEHGYFMNRKKVGHWDFTPSPSCFSNGTVLLDNRQYFQGEIIINDRRDKYYFLKDSISGFINIANSSLNEFSDTLLYDCFKSDANNYMCKYYFRNGQTIKLVPLEFMMDELRELLSGFRNREIREINRNNNR